jgi:hypothetical protein
LRRLRREDRRLTEELEILRSAAAWFADRADEPTSKGRTSS